MEAISQLILIICSIFGGIAWLITFLDKKFQDIDNKLSQVDTKLNDKVSQHTCKERRQNLQCSMLGSQNKDSLTTVLQQLLKKLESLEKPQ